MNYKANGVVALLIFVLGVLVLIYDNSDISHAVLIVCGVAFFVPGLVSVLGSFYRGHRKGVALRAEAEAVEKGDKEKEAAAREKARRLPSGMSRAISLICGFGGMGLGVCIWLMPDVFQPVVVWLFAILLIIGGIYQLALMTSRSREVGYPGFLLVGPLVILAAGVVLICVDYFHHYGQGFERNEFWMMTITGVCMLLYGIVGCIMAYIAGSHHHKVAKAAKAAAKAAEEKTAESEKGNDGSVKVGDGKVDGKLASALKLSGDSEEKPAAGTSAE